MKTSNSRPWQLVMFQRSLKKQQKFKALAEMLETPGGKHCLLVTCGDNNGALNWHFRELGGRWTWGDVQEENLAEISALLGEPVQPVFEDRLPFDDCTFDSIVAIDVLEHLEDDQPFLVELRRVLKPGAAALVTVPNGDPALLANRIKWRLGMTPEVYGHTRAGYSLAELSEAMQGAGLSPGRKSGYSRFFTEMLELVINFGYVFVLSRKKGGARGGQIAPATSQELKTHGAAYKLYTAVFPLFVLVSKLDRLLPARTNNAVIVEGVRT